MVPAGPTGLPEGTTVGSTDAPTRGVSLTSAPTVDATAAETLLGGAQPGFPEASGPLKVGQSFGPRYHIIKLLGAGGMGAVYKARDAELNVDVALKVIRGDRRSVSPNAEKQFKNELLLARQVTHKHVVRIHDLGEIDGIKYITMPYIEGQELAVLLRREGKLPVARALHFARHIASGLEAAHEAGVVHRDLKPANIMIGGAGDDAQALIMDFGISASTSDAASGTVSGTLEYMAPEQGRGEAVDARADIYAFGLILYEMLTGPRLVASTAPQERIDSMMRRFEQGLPSLRATDPSISEPLDALVTRCLERDPASRFQSSTELAAVLNRLDDDGELIPEVRRLTPRLMAAAAVLVVAMAGSTYFAGRRAAPVAPVQRDPVPVLIADFDNRSGDPVFDGSIEQTLGIALEGAPYITLFRTRSARAIAAELAPGKGNRITQEMGQLIARREGIKVLVAGALDKQGAAYRLELRTIDPATGNSIATAVRNVRDKEQVLNTITSMATTVREALGESKTEMATLAAAETVTAGSLEAMGAYARAQELALANKIPEALEQYQRAVDLDPRFGRAHAGMAVLYSNTKQTDKAEASYQAAIKNLDRMTDREKYRTLGAYYLNVAQNYEKAIENYETLVRLYPADDGGHGNLALAYVKSGDLPRAQPEVRKSLEIYPKNALQGYNYAMYSMYAGDFATAIGEASRLQKENPTFEYFYLPLALSQLAQGDAASARDTYASLSKVSATGASFAALGQADADMYFGQNRHAIGVLREGMAANAKSKDSGEMARKAVALAEAYLALGQRRQAAEAATQATTLGRADSIVIPAARVLLQAGQQDKALQIAADLEKMLQRGSTSYARLISGEVALENDRLADAIEAFRDAQKGYDSWFSRFLLGKAYVVAGGHFPEALAELEIAVKRGSETTDVFIDDMPTLRYLPPAYYWLARAQEGAGAVVAARQNYDLFLKLRAEADPGDPLAADARKRLAALKE